MYGLNLCMCTCTDHSLQSFVISSIASMLWKDLVVLNECQKQPFTIDQLEKLLSRSRFLPLCFRFKFNEVVSSEKKLTKEFYFNVLGYKSMFA